MRMMNFDRKRSTSSPPSSDTSNSNSNRNDPRDIPAHLLGGDGLRLLRQQQQGHGQGQAGLPQVHQDAPTSMHTNTTTAMNHMVGSTSSGSIGSSGAGDYSYDQLQALHIAKRMRLQQQQQQQQQHAHYQSHHQHHHQAMLMDPSRALLMAQQQQQQHSHSSQHQPAGLGGMTGAGMGMGGLSGSGMGMGLYPYGTALGGGMGLPGSRGLGMSGMHGGGHYGGLGGGQHDTPFFMGRNDIHTRSLLEPSGETSALSSAPTDATPPAAPGQRSPVRTHRQTEGDNENGRGSPLEKLSALASFMAPVPIALPNLSSTTNGANHHHADQLRAELTAKFTANHHHTNGHGHGHGNELAAMHNRDALTDHLICAPARKKGSSSPPLPPLQYPLVFKRASKPQTCTPSTSATDVKHFLDRKECMPLAIDEDVNWLSEFQHFLREEILEVFVASTKDVETRTASKKIAADQVGVRCRFCAHLHPSERASRSSAFPSSVRQIYQSFTMMLREHLSGQCEAIPADIKKHFLRLKGQSAQSASDSKRYWIYSAQKRGMSDSDESGIQWSAEAKEAAKSMAAFAASPELNADLEQAASAEVTLLVSPSDIPVVADFTYAIVKEAALVHLAASERIGNRSCLTVGLPGLACKHCCQQGRSGLSRVFPARKRNLKTKVTDLYDHLRRCSLVPDDVQENLRKLQLDAAQGIGSDKKSKVFYGRLWRRLGHDEEPVSRTISNSSSQPSSH